MRLVKKRSAFGWLYAHPSPKRSCRRQRQPRFRDYPPRKRYRPAASKSPLGDACIPTRSLTLPSHPSRGSGQALFALLSGAGSSRRTAPLPQALPRPSAQRRLGSGRSRTGCGCDLHFIPSQPPQGGAINARAAKVLRTTVCAKNPGHNITHNCITPRIGCSPLHRLCKGSRSISPRQRCARCGLYN